MANYKLVTKKYRPMCSGFRVFPSGRRCKGCPDCGSKTNKNDIKTRKVAVRK